MQTKDFYRYQDERGATVIVDSLSRVPEKARARAERVNLAPETKLPSLPSLPSFSSEGGGFTLDWPSFAVGFGAALVLVIVLTSFRRFSSPLARLVLFAIGGLLAGSAYLGWLRRSTGQGDNAFASPSALVEDTRRAVEALKQRNQAQQQQIDEILKTK